jgi:hypothetical protein
VKAAHDKQVAFNASVRDAVALFDDLARVQSEAAHQQRLVAQELERSKQEADDFAKRCDKATAALADLSAEVEKGPSPGDMVQAWGQWASAATDAYDSVSGMIGDFMELNDQAYNRQVEQLQDLMDRRREQIGTWLEGERARIDSAVEHGQMTEAEAATAEKLAIREARRKEQALLDQTKAERDNLLKSFEQRKKAAKAAALIDSIAAGVAMIPGFAWLGPLAPAAAATAAFLAYETAAESIDAAPPPEFPMGRVPSGSPDHRQQIAVRDDEITLNPRGSRRLGAGAAEAMNDGLPVGPTVVNLHVGGRLLAEAVVDELGDAFLQPTPGSWAAGKRALNSRGR